MKTFHSPYHFVPMSKWVYMPDYAHKINHDIPLQKGICGTIDLRLLTVTPTCVGAEQTREIGKESKVHFARNPLQEPTIPGTSLKGMLRNVLEIATFSKLKNLDDSRLSFRDISSSNNHYLGNIIANNKPVAGWLIFNDELKQWQFRTCKWAKVHHNDIDENLRIQIKNQYSAVAKYKKIPLEKTVFANVSEPRGKQENRWAQELCFDGTRLEPGHLVFTNMRILGKGEKSSYEFSYFFYDADDKIYEVDQQVSNLFANHGEEQVNYLKRHGNQLGMPVFALMQAGKVHSLGFARMPRVSYKNSIHDMVHNQNPAHHSDSYFDFSELLFGCSRDYGFGLRSRVSFSDLDAVDVKTHELYESHLLVLNGPKPSFYPAYVEQNANQTSYQSYENDQPLSGNKRYISRAPDDKKLKSNTKEDQNLNVASTLELCPTGKHFTGQIVFHNLHPIELGALLWTIQLEEDVVHQLGHGKPMGAGAVTLKPELTFASVNDGSDHLTIDEYIKQFIKHMNTVHPAAKLEPNPEQSEAWYQSPQVQYLLGIGRIKANKDLNTDYLDINKKEFQKAKTSYAKLDLIQNIKREEKGVSYGADKQPSLAYNKGRLADLFEQLEHDEKRIQQGWHDSVVNARKKREEQISAEKAKQERDEQEADKKANMGEYAYTVCSLAEKLRMLAASKEQGKITEKLNHTLDIFIKDVRESEKESAERLYWLARDYKYHQPSKKNKEKHKKKLQDLCTAYHITPVS